MGVRPGYQLSDLQSETGPHRELHWLGAGNIEPVSGMGWKQKVRARLALSPTWVLLRGHRDVVGSVNMHPLAFGSKIDVPAHVTYQRPGPVRVRARNEQPATVHSSRNVVVARTRATSPSGWCCLGESHPQPPLCRAGLPGGGLPVRCCQEAHPLQGIESVTRFYSAFSSPGKETVEVSWGNRSYGD